MNSDNNEILKEFANKLGEHFDNVLILCSTNSTSMERGSRSWVFRGSEDATFGMALFYSERQLEWARVRARKEFREDEE